MDTFIARIKANPLADGFDEIMISGEPEARLEAQRQNDGIPYREVDLVPLVQRHATTGRPLPEGLEGLA